MVWEILLKLLPVILEIIQEKQPSQSSEAMEKCFRGTGVIFVEKVCERAVASGVITKREAPEATLAFAAAREDPYLWLFIRQLSELAEPPAPPETR